ncbi:MAG: Glutamine transport ATP-binding protein GlnQ, partial [Pseudomonadota bacterium]
ALLKGAKVLLADEPVASLDPESARKVMDVLFGLTKELGMTLVVSLHQISIARNYCQRALGMSRGRLVFDGPITDLTEQRLKQLYGTDAQELLTDEASVPRHLSAKELSLVSA